MTDSNKSQTSKIAFQGELGAHSHIACRALYPDMAVLPCVRFDEVFAAVQAGAADLALIPIENTVAGRVADIHRLMRGLLQSRPLYIIGEYFMPIHHQLLAASHSTIAQLTHIHSHEMALAQCGALIAELDLTPIVTTDTAGAAREIAAASDPTHAAIAGALAAEIYGLDILRKNIEDSTTNTTRFLVMSLTQQDVAPDKEPTPRKIMTSFIFQVKNQPAALYKVLGCFANNNVNMTKLESYQPHGFLATQFYADIEGHILDPNIEKAFAALKTYCDIIQIFGTYPAAPERQNWT